MVTASERFLAQRQPRGRLGFLITSDEEGHAVDGTRRVMETLTARGINIDYCVVGEPSSSNSLGDTIKIGRRGSLSARLKVHGVEGHVAYPQLASNPIHQALPALAELSRLEWDQGNAAFPATSFQISNIHAGVGANNVIPGSLEVDFNFRYSTELDADTIKHRVVQILNLHGVNHTLDWHLSGEPFLTESAELIDAVTDSIFEVMGIMPEQSTGGGTSDGRFIAPTGSQVVELGPCNATIHKSNERVRIEHIEKLSTIYQSILEKLL
jgi:succinyl-diaminopimelate desuccinylase